MVRPIRYLLGVPDADRRVMAALLRRRSTIRELRRDPVIDASDLYAVMGRLERAGWAQGRREGVSGPEYLPVIWELTDAGRKIAGYRPE